MELPPDKTGYQFTVGLSAALVFISLSNLNVFHSIQNRLLQL